MKQAMTTHQRLKAATVEGLYWVVALSLRLGESVLMVLSLRAGTPLGYIVAVTAAMGYSLLLAPVRLGRQIWYSRLTKAPRRTPPLRTLWAGFRRWREAVGWRWSRWWRQAMLLLILAIPAALLWSYGGLATRLGDPNRSLPWLLLGGAAFLIGVAVVVLRRCRYALVPLLLVYGYPAALAVQLSVHMTRRRTGEWLNFWGEQLGRLVLCVVLPPLALWVMPPLRYRYTDLLARWLQQGQAALPVPA